MGSDSHGKENTHSSHLLPVYLKNGFYIAAIFALWILLVFSFLPIPINDQLLKVRELPSSSFPSICPEDTGRIYMYDLPAKFNDDLLLRCRSLNVYTDMCPYVANRGLGRPISSILADPVTGGGGGSWYVTHQFIAEMIFHARIEHHPCRTRDVTEAEIFYAPFYTGLYASSVFRRSELSERDRLAEEFSDFIRRQPPYRRSGGGDHFVVTGRTAWDFMRRDDRPDFGANRLFMMPEVRNMTILTVERHPWAGRNQFGIPYPSYFHPLRSSEVAAWQERVRASRRTHLFSFVGGPRKGLEKAAVREVILRQCGESSRCLRSKCEPGSGLCYQPGRVLDVMMRSEFCMQPPGDSFTRRSVFDSILAGCIPVFFSEHTAYTQYGWYLPESTEEYSVFVPKERWGRIEEELGSVPEPVVRRLRARVIELIPSLTYAHPNSTGPGFRDAVDVALVKLTQHVRQ